jgi:hypothetical protein
MADVGASLSTPNGSMTATRARGGTWCSTWCRQYSATLRKQHGLRKERACCCITSWRWQVLRSQCGDLSKSAGCAVPRGLTNTAPFRSPVERQGARSATTRRYRAPRPRKTKKPGGRFGHRASEFREAWNFPTLILISLRLPNLHRQTFT